ncbi:MAG: prolyl-tRNA synthetase associated domain-containing protein [Clostridia bacterium]|nr:prolyl-tRNA synthetase associated domain-containing protein [Clostridia bacterium]
MSTKDAIMARIRALSILHEYHEHAPAYTMEDCLALPYAAADVTFCKNLLLCNTAKTAFYLYVTLPDKPFRTSEVSKLLNSSRLSFAPAECLPRMLHLESGSLSPLGLWFDEAQKIQLVFDKGVRKEGRIAFHPCDNTATVLFRQEDFWNKVVPQLGHEPKWI